MFRLILKIIFGSLKMKKPSCSDLLRLIQMKKSYLAKHRVVVISVTKQFRRQIRRAGLSLDEIGEADHVLLWGVGRFGRVASVATLRRPTAALATAL